MYLLKSDYFRYAYEFDAHTISLSKKYYEQGAVQYLKVTKTHDEPLYCHVEAIVEVSGHLNACSFNLSYGRIMNAACDCQWNSRWHYCAHVGAACVMLTKVEIDEFPYVYQADGERIQAYFEEQERLRKEEELRALRQQITWDCNMNQVFLEGRKNEYYQTISSMLDDTRYHIHPEFTFYRDSIDVRFKIGTEKLYLIKNISEFLYRVENHLSFQYGKFLTVRHDLDRFDDLSKKWIQFLKEFNSFEYGNNKFFSIDESNISDFYDRFHMERIPGIHLYQDSFKVQFVLENIEDVIKVSMDGEFDLYRTSRGYYQIYEQALIYYPVENVRLFNDCLCKVQDATYLPKQLLNDFMRYCVGPYKEFIDVCDKRTEQEVVSYFPYETIEVYGDLKEDTLVEFRALAKDADGNVEPLLDNEHIEPSYTVDVISMLLSEHADQKENHCVYYSLENPELYVLVNEGINKLTKYAEVFVSEELKKLGKRTKYNLSVGFRMNNNLLEIDLNSTDFDVSQVSEILKAYHKKKRYVKLKSGMMIHLESDELEELDTMMQMYNIKPSDIKNGHVALDSYRALSLNDSMDSFNYIEVNKDPLKEYVDGFMSEASRIEMDPKYDAILRSYQKDGVKWLLSLYRYNLNGILADEMGLGKTLQVIVLLDSIRDKNKTSVVVCPASLVYNWEDEVSRFSDTLKCISITGTKQERVKKIEAYDSYDLIITSYDYLRRDIEAYEKCSFEYVILDEAQYIKNQKTKNAESVKSLCSKHRLALSGTPIENTLAELWSIFDFLMPDYLFNYNYFRSTYEVPITVYEDEETTKQLKKMVQPFILRRVKKEVLKDLPDKVEHKYMLEFSKEESKLYLSNLALINKDMQAKMGENGLDHIAILSMLTRLRQLCLDPRLLYDNIEKPSTKVSATIELLKVMKDNKKKVLLFSAFTSLLDLIAKELEKEDISYYLLTGATNKEKRREMVQNFNVDDTNVFLISLKAGGTGLNLTGAEVIIHIDPWWNISAQNQATDRAHRIGQNANVQVYQMIMKDSIEEKIITMQERKAQLAEAFVEGNEGGISKMSKEDLLELFER